MIDLILPITLIYHHIGPLGGTLPKYGTLLHAASDDMVTLLVHESLLYCGCCWVSRSSCRTKWSINWDKKRNDKNCELWWLLLLYTTIMIYDDDDNEVFGLTLLKKYSIESMMVNVSSWGTFRNVEAANTQNVQVHPLVTRLRAFHSIRWSPQI